jgi:glycosyltransferase involved in cell wall biosynthesis
MRILYVVHQFYPESSSGTERFLLGLAASVQRRGHHADVVTYSFSPKSDFHSVGDLLVREYTNARVSVTAVRHPRIPFEINVSMEDLAVMRFARDLLQNSHYDLLHVAHPMRLTSFIDGAIERGIPYVLTLTDFWILCPKINLQTSFRNLCCGPEAGQICAQMCPELRTSFIQARIASARKLLHGASAVVVPSQFAASIIQKEFADLRTTVIPHGVKVTHLYPSQRDCLNTSKIVFAYCGGFSPHKGVHTLLNAFRSLNHERAELRIYGAASAQEKDYERFLHQLAGNDVRIKFCGVYSNESMGEVFQAIDALVIPSLVYETYCFSLHEAFASNVPVIASAIGVLAEKVEDTATGFTFAPGNQAELAQKMKRLIEDPSILQRMKHNLGGHIPVSEEEEAYLYERIYQCGRKQAQASSLVMDQSGIARLNA